MFSWQEQCLTRSLSSLVRYCSCHSNIKFISSHHRVISSIYLYCVSDEFGNDFIHEERLQISEAGRKQNESILKSFSSLKHALVHNLEEKKVLRRNPPNVGVTSGQKSCTKIIYIVLQTSVGLF